jgi:hypothetical protein
MREPSTSPCALELPFISALVDAETKLLPQYGPQSGSSSLTVILFRFHLQSATGSFHADPTTGLIEARSGGGSLGVMKRLPREEQTTPKTRAFTIQNDNLNEVQKS